MLFLFKYFFFRLYEINIFNFVVLETMLYSLWLICCSSIHVQYKLYSIIIFSSLFKAKYKKFC